MPFGGEPRVCIGQFLAMAEVIAFVQTIFSQFSITPGQMLKGELNEGFTTFPDGQLTASLRTNGVD